MLQKRIEYQRYQPTFWRQAQDSREQQIPFFESLIGSDRAIALVHEQGGKVDGFIIAMLQPAPPPWRPNDSPQSLRKEAPAGIPGMG
jgi:hypothetical protein